MARSKKTTSNSAAAAPEVVAPAFNAKRENDACVAMGFVVQCDADMSPAPGINPDKTQLNRIESGMAFRWEDKVLEALRAIFGNRVSFFEAGPVYMGNPRTGVAKAVRTEYVPTALAPAIIAVSNPEPAPEPVVAKGKKGNGKAGKASIIGGKAEEIATPDYAAMTVAELRTQAKAKSLKTAGSKAVLVKRLQKAG